MESKLTRTKEFQKIFRGTINHLDYVIIVSVKNGADFVFLDGKFSGLLESSSVDTAVLNPCAILTEDMFLVNNDRRKVEQATQKKMVEYLEKNKQRIYKGKLYAWKNLVPPLMHDTQSNERVEEIRSLFEKYGLLDDWYDSLEKELHREGLKRKDDIVKYGLNHMLIGFDGVMIIPIKKAKPVIIFKKFGKPLYHFPFQKKNQVAYALMLSRIEYNYFVFWGGEKYGYDFPSEIRKQYGDDFAEFLRARCVQYNVEDLPEGVVEIPVKYLTSDKPLKIADKETVTPVKDVLREIGYLKDSRGKWERKNAIRDERDKIIIEIFLAAKKQKPLPIARIQERLRTIYSQRYLSDKSRHKLYHPSPATIRRVLNDGLEPA